MANDPVAKVERVSSHRYGKTLALDNVTLDIPAGQMVGMIGPDAAGKSTLLGLIAGVRIIQEGRCTLHTVAKPRSFTDLDVAARSSAQDRRSSDLAG